MFDLLGSRFDFEINKSIGWRLFEWTEWVVLTICLRLNVFLFFFCEEKKFDLELLIVSKDGCHFW